MLKIAYILVPLTLIACTTRTIYVYEPAPMHGRIVRWIDGDTCEIEIREGWREKVRLWGIDTPERGEPGFNQATRAAEARWPVGVIVTLTYPERKRDGSTVWRDAFGRCLATLHKHQTPETEE